MTKTTRLSGVMAAMLYLAFGIAHAADDAEAQQAQPKTDAISHPEQQPKPKEEATDTSSPQSDSAKPNEDPNCE